MKTKRIEKIYEDDDVLVINKPAPMLTIPDRYDPKIPNLKAILSKSHNEIFVLHRLDRGTSGALLFAKNAKAHRALSLQFEQNSLLKKYEALVFGKPRNPTFEVNEPLLMDPNHYVTVNKEGKPSRTSFALVKSLGAYAHIEAILLTGRTHQIRAHLKHIGLPLAVDSAYGYRAEFKLSTVKKNYKLGKGQKEKPLMTQRSSLHASELHFTHPISQKVVVAKAPLPKSMKAMINQLDKISLVF